MLYHVAGVRTVAPVDGQCGRPGGTIWTQNKPSWPAQPRQPAPASPAAAPEAVQRRAGRGGARWGRRGRATRRGAAWTPKYQRDTLGAATVPRHYFPFRECGLAGEGASRALLRPEGPASHGPGRAGRGAASSGGNCSSLPGKLIIVEPCHVVSGPAGVREPPRRPPLTRHTLSYSPSCVYSLLPERLTD